MKKLLSLLAFLVITQLSVASSFAQTATLADANKLLDFVEVFDPVLFASPTATQQANVAGSDWYLRVFSNSGITLAINADGTGPFFAGDVYALGGPFGADPAYLGDLASLNAFVDFVTADDDKDGVVNSEDQCADTPTGELVDDQGCGATQLDDDSDGVSNALDECANTPTGESVNGSGCSESQLDEDGDGVNNVLDQCPATVAGLPVTAEGCSAVQLGIIVTQEDADKLFGFAEMLDAATFSPPTATQIEIDLGSDWYVRTYTDTGISLEVSIDGTGAFFAGNVYVVGGPFGEERIFIDTLVNLVAFIDSLAPPDDDGDGVANDMDQCPDTPAGEAANGDGCSESQLGDDDDDNDQVSNVLDQCPGTPTGEVVNAQGCSASQLDDDNDGVSNALDQCPATPVGETANGEGCAESQLGEGDDDNDGVTNALDQCPATPTGEAVNAQGCSSTQLDDDNDGVTNALDQCPATPTGEAVNAQGCSSTQLDDDNDGVTNALDQCPATPTGEAVNAQGCSSTQLDDDNDGVTNALDQCPATPTGEAVNAQGCSSTQLDDDNDGVTNLLDQCPSTPTGEAVNAQGCSNTQLDDDFDGISNAADQCPSTPLGEFANAQGCSSTQLDDDNDGVNNALDQCPATPTGQAVDAQGCSESQNNGGGGGGGDLRAIHILDEGTGVCTPVPRPTVGTFARYALTTSESGETEFNLEFTERIIAVSDLSVTIEGVQNLAGLSETVSTTDQYFEIVDGLRFELEAVSESVTTDFFDGFPVPQPAQTSVTSYNPPVFSGPNDTFCEGMILFYPSVLETVTTESPFFGTMTTTEPTLDITSDVVSVNEPATVAAGSFNTILVSSLDEEGEILVWTDKVTGMLVKVELRDTLGNVLAVTELIELTQ